MNTYSNECVYVIKTWEYNHKTYTNKYAGLWEDCETGDKEFKTEEEAREQFEYATEGDKGYSAVSLVKIDPNSEDRETIIEEWEDNIESDEEEDEEENIDYIDPELVQGKMNLKKIESDEEEDEPTEEQIEEDFYNAVNEACPLGLTNEEYRIWFDNWVNNEYLSRE